MPNRVEEAASAAMGAMKAVKATVKGLHGVFKTLAEEHGRVSALLMRVRASSDPEVRGKLFPDIRRELLAHEKGELSAVYPAFRGHAELVRIADEHDAEASQLERLLNELTAVPYEDQTWGDRFAKLVKLVNRHTKEEENEYFPAAQEVMGKEEAERIDPFYKNAKFEIMQRASS